MRLISLMCAYREAKRSRQRKTKRDVELDRIYEEVEQKRAAELLQSIQQPERVEG